MQSLRRFAAALATALALSLSVASAQAAFLNQPLPKVELQGYSHTKAAKFEDFQGRAVLIEFFAYW